MSDSPFFQILHSTILVVDDDKSICSLFRRCFEKEGFGVVDSQTVEEAVRRMEDTEFDAVFSDIVIASGDDGIELLKTAGALQPDTPFVLITGRPEIETASMAVRFNAYDYLVKPLSRQSILRVARNAVETKKLRVERKLAEERNLAYRSMLEKSMAERTIELRISRERYRSLFAASKDAIFVVSSDGRLIDINKACLDILGYESIELKRMHFRDFFTNPGIGAAVFRMVEKQSGLNDHEVDLRKSDGEIRNCILSVEVLRHSERKVREYQVIVRDITAQKAAEEKIKKSRARLLLLRAAIEQSSDSIVVTDESGVCLYANPAYEAFVGCGKDGTVGKTPCILEPAAHGEEEYKAMRRAIESGKRWEKKCVYYRKGGRLYEEEAVVFPVFDDSNRIANFVIIERDVTEKRKLESVAEAANLMDNTGFIFSGIRHEIGNPINSLLTTLTVLERKLDELPPDTIRQFVVRAKNETDRVRFLLNVLKSFNLFENPVAREVELNRFVTDFEALIGQDFSNKGISVKKELPPAEIWAFLDPRAFHQVMLNLVANAAEALEGRENPEIVLRVGKGPDSVFLQIRDNGSGLSEILQKQLFTPFFTTKPHGTGLGLVIVKKLLLKMSGSIVFESRENAGTTVTITIPNPGATADE